VRFGVADPDTRITEPKIKEELRQNGERALAAGLFGVPTFVIDRELFWSADSTDMVVDYLREPQRFRSGEFGRVGALPIGAEHQQK
jgi:predicted DsbA family dithiol-disulfide isomerase